MATRPNRYRATLKKIHDSLSEEDKLNNLMLKRLFRSVLNGNRIQTGILVRAIKFQFPKSDVMVADTMFRALWQLGHYRKAIRTYIRIGRIFWLAEDVGRYYERRGQLKQAVKEYEYLINEYLKIKLIPLPNGPPQLVKVARWYAHRDKTKTIRYLNLYLQAAKDFKTDPALHLSYKNEAVRLLHKLTAKGEKEYANE